MDSRPRTLTINIRYGGLGDQLFWSHIPGIAKDGATRGGGYDKVYIRLLENSRDAQYIKLIWENNPYVDDVIVGFQDTITSDIIESKQPQDSKKGDVYAQSGVMADSFRTSDQQEPSSYDKIINPTNPFLHLECFSYTHNLLDNCMLKLGLDDGKRLHEPEICYTPKFREEYHKTIFDPNWISNAGKIQDSDIMHFFDTNNIQLDAVLAKRSDKCLFDYRADVEVIQTKSLEDFCDLLYSAKAIYCLVTGTATLAAALGKSANVIVGENISPYFLHSPLHTYIYLRHDKNLSKVWRYSKHHKIKLKVKTINRLSYLLPTKALRLAFRNLFVYENFHKTNLPHHQ